MTDGPTNRSHLVHPSLRLHPKVLDRFVVHTLEMRLSHAWAALPPMCRGLLDRVEVEHMARGGAQNGNLYCLYEDFEAWGCRRGSIPIILEICQALGFLEITRQGGGRAGGQYVASTYRLTYVKGVKDGRPEEPTNEWRRFKSMREAADAVKNAQLRVDVRKAEKAKRRSLTNISLIEGISPRVRSKE